MALSGNAQENVLIVLCYGDSASIVAGMVKPSLFDNEIYRTVAERAVEYILKYRHAPKNHIADLLENELRSKNRNRADSYAEVIGSLHQAEKDGFNEDYIVSGLREFVRQQRLKNGILKSAKLLQTGKVDQAENIILSAIRSHDEAFDAGTTLHDTREVLRKMAEANGDFIPTGIDALDRLRIGISRKTLFLLMASTNRGKTWGLIQIGKAAMLRNLRVLHVTLEMSEERILARYLQSLFSLRRRGNAEREVRFTYLKKEQGTYVGHRFRKRERPALNTRSGKRLLRKRLTSQRFASRLKLIIKEFPTSALSTKELDSYLDYLDRYSNFIPDVIIIDYPDLMEISSQYLRVDTGRIYKELRGLGVKRNAAIVAATQANRPAENVSLITFKHASEDYSKMATADTVITYNQTEMEQKANLARLYVLKARDERRGDVILLSQAYEVGQFHMDSAILERPGEFLKSLED